MTSSITHIPALRLRQEQELSAEMRSSRVKKKTVLRVKENPETLKYLQKRKNIGFRNPLCGVGKHLTEFKVRLQDKDTRGYIKNQLKEDLDMLFRCQREKLLI